MQLDLHAVLRGVARAPSFEAVATALASGIASRSVVLARVWVKTSDALTLRASAGTPSGGGSYSRVDGDFREMAVADTTIAAIAESREPVLVRGLRGDEDWLINPSWAARQGVRAFVGLPLIADATAVGVLAVFDREIPSDPTIAQLQLLADVAAARVADLTSVPAGDLRPSQEPPSPRATSVPTGGDGGSFAGTEVASGDGGRRVITREEWRRLEKANIEAALDRTGGKVFGAEGAAALLGMKPTTLASRIKALGIR